MVADDVIHISIRVDNPEDLLNASDDFVERVAYYIIEDNPAYSAPSDEDK